LHTVILTIIVAFPIRKSKETGRGIRAAAVTLFAMTDAFEKV
jgi:hypothetical protein